MEKKLIIGLTIGGVLIAGGIGFYLYNKSKAAATLTPAVPNPQGANLGTTNNVTNTPAQQVANAINTAAQTATVINGLTTESFPLKVGMIGPNVKAMQAALKSKFNEVNVASDGVFGAKTLIALVNQKYATYLDSSVTQSEFNDILAGKKK